ncbi:uncharacterized protein BCR38DRAFT_422942 [Pseudomassariella vexata]|uniref:Uncharacterized protein n=1 Tax=Pseudomassariella vexata TaxID=1141098 RepID=A0A1Y2E9V5_9PEZI|nr:uncharacterized protein BCR38DRAFT_422942 [Pseudomassariella vexata]ORY68360.1 hypothetical protein BCR38DRAFT_422942 [Pseudomassariella vexata]
MHDNGSSRERSGMERLKGNPPVKPCLKIILLFCAVLSQVLSLLPRHFLKIAPDSILVLVITMQPITVLSLVVKVFTVLRAH